MSDIAQHILSLEEAVKWRNSMREKNLTVAVTNGCFDLLHRGHAVYLDAARDEADALLVLVNSDESVRALKGPERPLQCEDDRAFLCWTYDPEITYVLEYNPSKVPDSEIIKIAESVEPVEK